MAISKELANRFFKSVNEKEKSLEQFVFATVVSQNSSNFIKIDGSEMLTPALATIEIQNGDRVKVSIKDHKAIIVSNISSPSASKDHVDKTDNKVTEMEHVVANKVNTEDLNATNAKIENLSVENIKINNQLTANSGRIDTLESDNVTIHGSLTAAEANINKLKTEKINADYVETTFAKVSDLEATNATIHNLKTDYGEFKVLTTNEFVAIKASIKDLDVSKLVADLAYIKNAYLQKVEAEEAYLGKVQANELYASKASVGTIEADVANINTLLSGSTTSGSIHTIVLTAQNTNIANALIKSANIESLDAKKITGLDIDTTSLTVHSSDGKSSWKDNTIQIKDDARVRVQIGKDAQGDYNMYVWDKTGNLMFDATGLHADGIKDSIIVDSMVAPGANISGDKLNIGSVINKINEDGSSTIHTSKLDYNGQSFNVIFNDYTSKVNKNEESINSQSTELNVQQGKINSLISESTQTKSDVTTLQNKYSEISQNTDKISLTVQQHTSELTNIKNDGIMKIVIEYAVHDSDTISPETGWTPVKPDNTNNKYIWQRVATTKFNGTIDYSTPVCMTGADGTSIDSITKEFYVSDSKTEMIGGNWTTVSPTFVSGKYLWIRDKIIFINPSKTEYTTPYCDGTWDAINDVEKSIRLNTNKISNITSDLDSIRETVSETQTDLITQNNTILGIENRVSIAEEKITSDAIITTVTKSKEWSNNQTAIDEKINGLNDSLKSTNDNINVKIDSAIDPLKQDITSVTQSVTTVTQTSENILTQIKEVNNKYNDLTKDGKLNTVITYFDESSKGLEIGKSDSSIKTLMAPDHFAIIMDNIEVMQLFKNMLLIDNITARKSVRIGNTILDSTDTGFTMSWTDSEIESKTTFKE